MNTTLLVKILFHILYLLIAIGLSIIISCAVPIPGPGLLIGGALLERSRFARYFVLRTNRGRKHFRRYRTKKQQMVITTASLGAMLGMFF
jgi:hypothetical protein